MTRKRYQKLFRSEMTKLMRGQSGASACIKGASTNNASVWKNGKSYLEMWTALRQAFTYPGNIPPIK